MTLPLLLQPGYWFGLYPLPLQPQIGFAILMLMLALVCLGIGLGVYARFALKRDKTVLRAWRWLSTATFWAGLTGLYLYAVTVERVPVLGMRAWYIAWFILFAWIIIKGLVHLFREIPSLRREEAGRDSYEKWLPKPKK